MRQAAERGLPFSFWKRDATLDAFWDASTMRAWWVYNSTLAGLGLAVCLVAFGGAQTPGLTPAAEAGMAAGSAAMRRGDLAAAVTGFKAATVAQPRFAEAWLNLGLAFQQQGDALEAGQALERARGLKPGLRGANLFLGIADYQRNLLEAADEALHREVKLNPADAKAWMWLGVTQTAEGHPERAAGSLDTAYGLAPKDPDILYHRGRAHLLVSKGSYEAMFAMDPNSYRVHEVLGQAAVETQRSADAIAEYKLAIQAAPRQAGLHEELGDLYWSSGATAEADAAYTDELALDPYSFTATYKLGSLRVTDGQPREALAPLTRAVALDPIFETTYYYLGRAEVETGAEAAGVANLERAAHAANDTPLNTLADYQLNRVYRRLNRMDEANGALARFRSLRDAAAQEQAASRESRVRSRTQLPQQEAVPTEAQANQP